MTPGFDQGFSFDVLVSWFPDLIGCLGALLVLIAYAFLQLGKLKSNGILFSFLNFIAAFMILISLFHSWNLAAVMMEIAWMLISAYGIVNILLLEKLKYKRH